MSSHTIATLPRITREALSTLLLAEAASVAPAATATTAAVSASPGNVSTNAAAAASSSSPLSSPIAIVDVRDSDHIGGHIRSSMHVPSGELDWRMPELVRQLNDKETVIFHCALSQQRGPSAALRYLRERDRQLKPEERTGQKVLVLDGGFTKWQEKFGSDKRLTDAYQKDLWEFGY